MSHEDELTPPSDRDPRAAMIALRARLADEGLTLEGGEPRTSRRIYLDTFDGRLRAAGLTVVHLGDEPPAAGGSGELVALDREGGAERAALRLPAPHGPLLALELDPGAMRELLLPIVDVRALLPLVELVCTSIDYTVHDNQDKTVVRLSLEQATLATASEALRPRLEIAPVKGYERERRRVAACAQELGFTVPRHRLLDEAVLAAGGDPGGTSSKIGVELLATQRADAAAAAILRRLLEVIEDNFEGTIAATDAEFLHDLRVAVRRIRSVLRELRGVFPPAELGGFRAEFRWLQAATGPSRDLDVYVLDFDELRAIVPEAIRADLDPVLRVLHDHREVAHRAMVRDLQSPRTRTLLRDWSAFLDELVALPVDDRPDAERAIGELAGERIRRVYRKILKMGDAIDASSPSGDYHEIRKTGKELRYLLELFGAPLFPADAVKPMIKTLKALQDVLGRHQDREVQVGRLRELAEPVSMLPGRAAALMAMGVLVERLHEQELEARAEFAETYAEFSSPAVRKLVKATFR